MPRTIQQFVRVVTIGNAGTTSSVVDINVGDSLAGLNPVSIIGGNYNPSDPWVIELMQMISATRKF